MYLNLCNVENDSINCIHSWHLMNNKAGCLLHGSWHHETHQMILQYGWSSSCASVSKPVLIGKSMLSWLMMHWLKSVPWGNLTLSWYNQTCIFSKITTLKWIEYGKRITGCDVILCIRHVRRAWLKNVNQLSLVP